VIRGWAAQTRATVAAQAHAVFRPERAVGDDWHDNRPGASSPQSKLLQRPSLVLALMGQTRLPGLVAENVSLSLQDNPSSNGASPLVHSRIQPVLLRNRTDVCVKCLALSTFRPSAETGPHGLILCT